MMILLAVAAVVVATPLIAVVLVSFASLREESVRSLAGRPPGRIEAAVRKLLCLHTRDLAVPPALWPVPAPRMPQDDQIQTTLTAPLP